MRGLLCWFPCGGLCPTLTILLSSVLPIDRFCFFPVLRSFSSSSSVHDSREPRHQWSPLFVVLFLLIAVGVRAHRFVDVCERRELATLQADIHGCYQYVPCRAIPLVRPFCSPLCLFAPHLCVCVCRAALFPLVAFLSSNYLIIISAVFPIFIPVPSFLAGLAA